MAGASEVLQEYLVKLGFQTDASALKKFEDGLGKTEKTVFKVGTAAATAALAVEAAVAEFAYSMRKMSFTAELSKTTVANLQQMGFAGKQIGISNEEMASTIQNLGMVMRRQGMTEYISALTGINEKGRDTKDVFLDLIPAIKKQGGGIEQVEMQIAESLGISSTAYLLAKNHLDELTSAGKDAAAMQAQFGMNSKQAEADAKAYANQIDKLKFGFMALEQSVMSGALPTFIKINEQVVKFLAILTRGVGGDITGMLSDMLHGRKPGNRPSGAETSTAPTIAPTSASTAGNTPQTSKLNRNERNNNPGNLEFGAFAVSHGAIGSDGRFAVFPDMQTGFAAQQALLSGYGKKGINTVGGIVSRYAPSSENNTAAYAADVSKQMGVGTNQQLNMNDPAVVANLSRAMARHEGASSATLANLDNVRLGGGAGGGGNLTIHNDIKIASNDAKTAKDQMIDGTTRLNGDQVRQFKSRIS